MVEVASATFAEFIEKKSFYEKIPIKIPKKFHDNIHEICIELQFNQEEQLFDIINHCLN